MKLFLFLLGVVPFAIAQVPQKRELSGYPSLEYKGNNGKPQSHFPLGRCEGDCDSDAECAAGLVCFDDPNSRNVPGCSGERSKNRRGNYNDYCYSHKPNSKPHPKPTQRPEASKPSPTKPSKPEATTPRPSPSPCMTIAQIVQDSTDFGTLEIALIAADLVETLNGEGPFTVFAPTDAAFANLDQSLLMNLIKPENQETLRNILLYHVISGEIYASDFRDGQQVTMLQGQTARITKSPPQINGVDIIDTDIEACNGVIQVIEAVLIPPEDPSEPSGPESPQPQPPATPEPRPESESAVTPKPVAKPTAKPSRSIERGPKIRVVGCSRNSKCDMCEGDCDSDNDCKDNLKCFQRDRGERKRVPHCSGGERDGSRTDYCTKPW